MARRQTPERKLTTYRAKRDFRKTREPSGKAARKSGHSFVVHKHHARRLHWDLRLEVGGVLASWAVPKEPPNHPGVRRLAVHVEDHPLEYGKFEGEIPKGEYGAGKVEIWDKGEWRTDEPDPEKAIAKGKIDFELHGGKLDGEFVLVRMGEEGDKENWLLFKKGSDRALEAVKAPGALPGAKEADLPESLRPMLCTRRDDAPKGEQWVHEVKWDGYRALVFLRKGRALIKSRNGNLFKLPEIQTVFEESDLPDAVIDGELVSFDDRGISSFRILHETIRAKHTKDIFYYVFDLPFYAGFDLRHCALEDRKAVLERLVEQLGSSKVHYSAHTAGDGPTLFQKSCEAGLEGLISKKLGTAYSSIRSPNWVKARCEGRLEGWIGGFTRHSTGEAKIGALLVGMKDKEERLLYVGKVGTGFSEALRAKLWKELDEKKVEKSPFEPSPELPRKGVFWVEPETAVTCQYLEWAEGGVMRHPKLVKIGDSPAPKAKDLRAGLKALTEGSQPPPPTPPPSRRRRGGSASPAAKLPITISNPQRVIDPSSGLTKGDIAAYYHAVAEWILPHLEGRPLPVLRCPDGIVGSCFFHKHWIRGLNEAVQKVRVEEESGKEEPYMAIEGETGLLSLAQFGVVEFHPWGSRVKTLEQPDILIFDLDPCEGLAYSKVVEAAHHVREELQKLGLESFAKLSGGKGIHVVVPIKPELEWDDAKAFSENFSRLMAKAYPDRYTASLPKTMREGKIFLDYLRNGRGATAVVAYGLRARKNLPVAMPVEWDEVTPDLAPSAYSLRDALEHLSRRKQDPWKDFFKLKQSLKKVLST